MLQPTLAGTQGSSRDTLLSKKIHMGRRLWNSCVVEQVLVRIVPFDWQTAHRPNELLRLTQMVCLAQNSVRLMFNNADTQKTNRPKSVFITNDSLLRCQCLN
jgi:hypothetical protein